MSNDASVAAIQFALEADEGLLFLSLWNEGEFGHIRKSWPDAPEEVFIGADPLHPGTKAMMEEPVTAIAPLPLRSTNLVQIHDWLLSLSCYPDSYPMEAMKGHLRRLQGELSSLITKPESN